MAHTFCHCCVHIIFSTKERYPFFADHDLRSELHRYLGGVLKSLGCKPVQIGGVEDHVHVLCILGKQVTVADLVKELKRVSSKWLGEGSGSMIKKFSWQSGYGAFSVSSSAIGEVISYIANQEEHHARMSFQNEYRSLLNKHGLDYDEKYLWD